MGANCSQGPVVQFISVLGSTTETSISQVLKRTILESQYWKVAEL
jgi:hypothetical protein